jgi:hypothetical protein
LDAMSTGGITAMVSTQSEPWPSIPEGPLMDALARKTANRVIRRDSVAITGAPIGPVVDHVPAAFTVRSFWVDHHIALRAPSSKPIPGRFEFDTITRSNGRAPSSTGIGVTSPLSATPRRAGRSSASAAERCRRATIRPIAALAVSTPLCEHPVARITRA